MTLAFNFAVITLIEQKKVSRQSLSEVKKWLTTTNLPQIPKEFIALFLLSCGDDVLATQKKIEAYFRIKKKTPSLFNNWDLESEEIKKIIKVLYFCVIPRRLNDSVIVIVKLKDTNYRNLNVVAALKLSLMVASLVQNSDPPDKLIIILDMRGARFMHLSCIKLKPMLAHLDFVQEAFPLKVENIHILNGGYIFGQLFAICKSFLGSELRSIIKAYPKDKNLEEFYREYVPSEFLPKEYGGSLSSLEELTKKTVQDLRQINDFFRQEEELRESYCEE